MVPSGRDSKWGKIGYEVEFLNCTDFTECCCNFHTLIAGKSLSPPQVGPLQMCLIQGDTVNKTWEKDSLMYFLISSRDLSQQSAPETGESFVTSDWWVSHNFIVFVQKQISLNVISVKDSLYFVYKV